MESKSQTSYINSRPIIFKVQLFWKGHKNLKKSPTCFDARLLSENSCFAKTGGLFFQIVWPSHKVLTLHVSRKNINIVANPFTKILFDFKLHNYGYSWIKTYIRNKYLHMYVLKYIPSLAVYILVKTESVPTTTCVHSTYLHTIWTNDS